MNQCLPSDFSGEDYSQSLDVYLIRNLPLRLQLECKLTGILQKDSAPGSFAVPWQW